MRQAFVVFGFLMVGVAIASAQPLSTDAPENSELVKPPELRSSAARKHLASVLSKTKRKAIASGGGAAAVLNPLVKQQGPKDVPGNAIDFGVQVHGAGNDPHFYTTTAASPAFQETGNGASAGFRFGF